MGPSQEKGNPHPALYYWLVQDSPRKNHGAGKYSAIYQLCDIWLVIQPLSLSFFTIISNFNTIISNFKSNLQE